MDKSTTLPLSYQPTVPVPMMPMMAPAAPSTIQTIDVDDPTGDDGPSRHALLQRAAELGPGPRATMHSMFMSSNDPVLAEKREPRVIERRARFRRVVKVALGLCAGFCLFATAATAFSSSKASEGTTASTAAHTTTTAPASVVSEKQTLEVASTTKAKSNVVAPTTVAPKRTAKRR